MKIFGIIVAILMMTQSISADDGAFCRDLQNISKERLVQYISENNLVERLEKSELIGLIQKVDQVHDQQDHCTGRIVWFDPAKRTGVIKLDSSCKRKQSDGMDSAYVHSSQVLVDGTLEDQDRVGFYLETSPRGLFAMSVRRIRDK